MSAEIASGIEDKEKFADPKRYLWPFSYALAAITPLIAIVLSQASGSAWPALIPLIVIFALIPLLDTIVGEDKNNLSEAALKSMAEDKFYMGVVYAVLPIGYVTFIATIAYVVAGPLPFWADMALLLGTATMNGSMITIGHELGHKTDPLNRLMAKFALGSVGYGHFTVEHNLGHHRNVSTPEDCASGRLGESVYSFAMREIPGALKGAWAIERRRLEKRGQKVWSRHNEILQPAAITVSVAVALVLVLGWKALPWIVLHHAVAWFGLTLVNYIEHYGLLRARRENGRYAPCEPRHSWNANHIVSNLVQFHLQRHSDHHSHPARPYQTLRHFDGAPQLPTGYPGCMFMAMIPPLWFRVMNPKVMAWAEGDLERTNIHPPAREKLLARWGEPE